MTNTKQKGDAFERLCQKKLEDSGYVVMKSPRKFIFIGPGRIISKANDYFNLYDLCAKKNNQTRWIQCKYGDKSNVSRSKAPIQEFHNKYMSDSESSEIWYKDVGSRIIEIYQYDILDKEFRLKQEEKK